jgi:regulatory protein
MGPRTRRQLEDKLRDRGCDPAVAAGVLDRMSEVGLVDDEAFAEMFVRSRQETKGLAAVALRRELRDKGVADDVVDAALEEIDPEREKEQARALVSRRLRTMRGLDRDVQTRRLAAFLARKGYGSGVSFQVIREALDDLPEHARD